MAVNIIFNEKANNFEGVATVADLKVSFYTCDVNSKEEANKLVFNFFNWLEQNLNSLTEKIKEKFLNLIKNEDLWKDLESEIIEGSFFKNIILNGVIIFREGGFTLYYSGYDKSNVYISLVIDLNTNFIIQEIRFE